MPSHLRSGDADVCISVMDPIVMPLHEDRWSRASRASGMLEEHQPAPPEESMIEETRDDAPGSITSR
ncbi:unnamed protein product [Haemonchus placei]|uniref:Uncharacterized protein n=1 Tax=Haemonchus placei TaxID=6290 RepID=A0A0N4W5Z7_HAEPC|nr:unnamed protein product [Haemonchus placei]